MKVEKAFSRVQEQYEVDEFILWRRSTISDLRLIFCSRTDGGFLRLPRNDHVSYKNGDALYPCLSSAAAVDPNLLPSAGSSIRDCTSQE